MRLMQNMYRMKPGLLPGVPIKFEKVETMKFLGKIEKVRLGTGGYQDAMFGFTFQLMFDGSSCITDFWGHWSNPPSESAKWTIEDQNKYQSECYTRFRSLMRDAKVNDIRNLEGIPIEVETDNMKLVSWRILKEVL